MDRSHIFVQISEMRHLPERQYQAHVALYAPSGEAVFYSQCPLAQKPAVTRTGGIDTMTQEAVVRFITRAYAEQDVGMSTPMFATVS
jgi:hypothetical protein